MLLRQRFESLILLTFCLFLVNGFVFTPEIGMGEERFPFHRYLILMELFLFVLNIDRLYPLLQRNILIVTLPLYVMMTSLWSYNYIVALKETVFLLASIILGIQAAVLYTRKKVPFTLVVEIFLVLLVISSILLAFIVPSVGIDSVSFSKPRWVGITSHPNKLGVLCMLTVWYGIGILIMEKAKIYKAFAIGAVTISGATLVGTDSVTSIIASCASCICAWYVLSKKNRLAMFLLSFVILVAIIYSILFLDFFSVKDISQITGRDISTLTGRTYLWHFAIEAIKAKPILGWGFGGFEGVQKYLGVYIQHFHDGYLQVVVQGGVVLLMLLAIFSSILFKNVMIIKRSDLKSYAILISGLLMVMIHNLAETTLMHNLHPLWLVAVFLYFSVRTQALIIKGTAQEQLIPNTTKGSQKNHNIMR